MAAASHLSFRGRAWLQRDDPQFAEPKGAIVPRSIDLPPNSTVLCVDELGPAVKAYPGPNWSEAGHRPHFRPDDARHGYVWASGALAHRCRRVLVGTAERRSTASWLHVLDPLEGVVPAGEVYLIVDALPLHWSLERMLWTWGHPRFYLVPLPKAAA